MRFRFALSVALLAALAACNSGFTNPSQNTTETFSDTIQPGAGNSGKIHTFSAGRNGEVTITLTQFLPTYAGFATVVYGQVVSGSCIPIYQNNFVRTGTQVYTGVIQQGSYCVAVYDQGPPTGFTVAETYTVTVNHP